MSSYRYGLYAIVFPGNAKREWWYDIYRADFDQNTEAQDAIYKDTYVRTSGCATSQARAVKKAQKRIIRMVKAYDMLARKMTIVE